VRFFLDNHLSFRLANALHALADFDGDEVVHISQKFGSHPSRPNSSNARDEIWLPALAEEGDWVVVSGDTSIRKKPRERQAFLDAGLMTFFLASGWTNMRYWDQAQLMVRWWPVISTVAKATENLVFEVPRRFTGKLKPITD
jgi:hypothetical protein